MRALGGLIVLAWVSTVGAAQKEDGPIVIRCLASDVAVEWLSTGTREERMAAIASLKDCPPGIQDPQAASGLSQIVSSPNDYTAVERAAAAGALGVFRCSDRQSNGRLPDCQTVPVPAALAKAVRSDPEPRVREAAAYSLAGVGSGQEFIAETLKFAAIHDSSPQAQAAAVHSLAKMGKAAPDICELFAGLLASPGGVDDVRKEAAQGLGACPANEAINALNDAALYDRSPEVREQARLSLARLDSPEARQAADTAKAREKLRTPKLVPLDENFLRELAPWLYEGAKH